MRRPIRRDGEPSANADVWVVIPAFNEALVIGPIVRHVRSICPNVVVVDDGSHDPTGRAALEAGAVVVRHPVNLGQGAALQTGIEYGLRRGAAYVATFDADGQHQPDDLAQMITRLRQADVDVVLGSRFLGRTKNMPVNRRWVLRAAVVLSRVTSGVKLTDAHNGLRVMTAATARRLRLVQDQMAHASEFVAQIGTLGVRYTEIPVTIMYTPYSLKKGQKITNGVRILSDLIVGWLLR